jgi:hypothetical protein
MVMQGKLLRNQRKEYQKEEHLTTRKVKYALPVVFAFLLLLSGGSARADLITNGFTFSVASGGGDTTTGTHFHSSTAGDYGNPAGKAEVGRYSSEEVRGLSEYNIAGLSSATSAFVTFNVFQAKGLFPGVNDFPFNGTIKVDAYAGNNAENTFDYQAASLGSVGAFSTTGLLVGNVLSFDITSIYNAAITGGSNSLGMRLAADPLLGAGTGAWTFDSFRLTTDNLSSVPEPATLMLLGLGLIGLAGARRRKA